MGLFFRTLLLAALCSTSSIAGSPKILMMVPNEFLWSEYNECRKTYEMAGFQFKVAGKTKDAIKLDPKSAKDNPKAKPLLVDLTFDQVAINDYEAVTFLGGPGAWQDFFPNPKAHEILKRAFRKDKLVGLLSDSSGILGLIDNWDGNGNPLGAGKKVVGSFRVEGMLRRLALVNLIPGSRREPGTAIDGNLITGRNPESSKQFALAVVAALRKRVLEASQALAALKNASGTRGNQSLK